MRRVPAAERRVSELELSTRRRPATAIALLLLPLISFVVLTHVIRFRDSYVFLLVEESSTASLRTWPLTWEGVPGAFADPATQTLSLPRRRDLTGVCLALHYSATSLDVEIQNSVRFSRTGKLRLSLTKPISLMGCDINGEVMELVENRARVIEGDLVVEKTSADGAVHLNYAGNKIILGPGDTWERLVMLRPEGKVILTPDNWRAGLAEAMTEGYPLTRIVFANMGLWPKANVHWGESP